MSTAKLPPDVRARVESLVADFAEKGTASHGLVVPNFVTLG
jgi:hypothetical protein